MQHREPTDPRARLRARRASIVPAVLLAATACVALARAAEPPAPPAQDAGTPKAGGCWPSPPGTDPLLCPPDDPEYPRRWEFRSDIPPEVDRARMHPAEVALGAIGFSLDRAWQLTVGRPEVVIAVLDSGIRWSEPELVHKLFLNPGELPIPAGAERHDANGDGVFEIGDYADDPRVGDRNANGVLDPGDLILAFSDCRDDDGNGYTDDISGYDFFGVEHCGLPGGDNDPADDTGFGHGTGIAGTAAGETNNGREASGVCPRCRVLPVRIGDSFVVDANQFARGVVFAVRSGVDVIASATGAYNNTTAARRAVDIAYDHGVPLIGSAADEYSYHHNFPSVYDHALYVNAMRDNFGRDYRRATTFWGVNPCTNFGARVWLSVPARSCSSGATSRLAGVTGLIQSMAREARSAPLHAEEVYQVLRATADDLDNRVPDWGPLLYAARAGFDQLYGYGRLNALRAVRAVRDGEIPPRVDLDGPPWFAVVSPGRSRWLPVEGSVEPAAGETVRWALEYALGVEPEERAYHTVAAGSGARRRALLGILDFERLPLPGGPPPLGREDRDRYSVTLRLRATDGRGRVAEARRSFFVLDDPTWKEHFPVELGCSGEASPVVTDLDGDGRDEIVLGTADGEVVVFEWQPSRLRRIRMPLDAGPPLGPTAPGAAAGPEALRPRDTIVRGAVVGDLTGDGSRTVVVASREGRVYAFDRRGERRAGFPVSVERRHAGPATRTRRVDAGILSRPTLADLDGEPGLEIVVSALDGFVYAWHGNGRPVSGFPLRLGPDDPREKIVSSPAVGDLDGDGRPEIVVGTNRVDQGLGEVWAVRAGGAREDGGPFVPGLDPLGVAAVRDALLPTLATGVAAPPLLTDVDGDGDVELLVYAVTGDAIQLVDLPPGGRAEVRARLTMGPGVDSSLRDVGFLGGTGSALVADTDHDGRQEVYAPLLPLRMLTLRAHPGVPLDVPLALGGWELAAGPERLPMLPTWPRRMEDLMIFAGPAAADVDGDGTDEVLMGSGGYLLHAFARGGGEAQGFPKFTGGWTFSTPAVGDLDGDGVPELVSVTREGYLFAWSLAPRSRSR